MAAVGVKRIEKFHCVAEVEQERPVSVRNDVGSRDSFAEIGDFLAWSGHIVSFTYIQR